MASYFEGASDFEIRSLRVENIHGDYIDERNTVINDHEVSRATYNQEGVLGVVNDRGTFRGTINCTRRLPTARDCTTASIGYCRPISSTAHHSHERNPHAVRTPHSITHHTKDSTATFFKDASCFDVGDMDVKNVSGNRVDRGTAYVNKKITHERHYNQRGALFVVNGSGKMSGTINYGGKSVSAREYLNKWDCEEEGLSSSSSEGEEEESSAEDSYEHGHRLVNKCIKRSRTHVAMRYAPRHVDNACICRAGTANPREQRECPYETRPTNGFPASSTSARSAPFQAIGIPVSGGPQRQHFSASDSTLNVETSLKRKRE